MFLFQKLAEQRLQEAHADGAFEDLPGQGRPLELEDDSQVPAHLRIAYRMLRNSGHLPPELEANAEIRQLEDLLERVEEPAEKQRARARLRVLVDRVQTGPEGRTTSLATEHTYKEKLLRRFREE